MAYCTNCSRQIKETAKFCIYCGTPRTRTTRQNVRQQSHVNRGQQQHGRPATQATPTRPTQRTRVIDKSVNVETHMHVPTKKEVKTKRNVQTQRKVVARRVDESLHVDPKVYQINQRLGRRYTLISRYVDALSDREDFSRSDATLLYNYINELKVFTKEDKFDQSDFAEQTRTLLDKANFLSVEVFEYLTRDIQDEELKTLRYEWSIYHHKIKDRLETIDLLDKLEKQNKVINKRINELEKIFGTPSHKSYYKSQLFTEFNTLRNYYLNRLSPVITKYLEMIDEHMDISGFKTEKKLLLEIQKYVDPNITHKEQVSTKKISDLCFKFIEVRGINSSDLRLKLASIEEELKRKEERIKVLQKSYWEYMWNLINKEDLTITPSDTLISDIYTDQNSDDEEQSGMRQEAQDGIELLSLNKLAPLDKLQPLKDWQ